MRRLALLGGAERTRGGVFDSQADEVWTLNWFYRYDWVPRIDRLFDMHPLWLYIGSGKAEWRKPEEHWEYLHQKLGYPVYMLKQIPEIPNCIAYPINGVVAELFGSRLRQGKRPKDFFSSSFDYMMALAICEGWDVIELYGFEMGSDTEYRYQREGAAFFIGQAIARGIEVILPEKTVLLRSRRYGYDGAEMIYRQDIERIKDQWERKYRDSAALVQYYEGRLSENPENGNAAKHQKARDDALVASGGLQLAEFMLKHIDLEEPELEIRPPFESIGVKNE